MKKAIVLILLCLLVSIPLTFGNADEMTAGEYLKVNGVLQGNETGDLMPEEKMTRAEMIKIFLTLLNLDTEAASFPKNGTTFVDVSADDWYAPYVGYAEVYGYTNGMGDGTFAPNKTVTKQQVATFLLRGLGYENAWEGALEKASTVGINVSTVDDQALLRGEVFDMMKDALAVPVKGTEKNLASFLGIEANPIPEIEESIETQASDTVEVEDQEPPMVEDLEVTGPETIEITFNEEVTIDDLSIEVKERYATRNTLEIESIDQIDDERIKVVTMGQETATLYNIHIEGAKDLAGNIMLDDTERSFSGISGVKTYENNGDGEDNESPVVKKLEVTEPETIVITFNEKINIDEISVEVKEKYGHKNAIDVVSIDTIDAGTVKVVTNGQSTATLYVIEIKGVMDTAGNVMAPDTDRTFAGIPK